MEYSSNEKPLRLDVTAKLQKLGRESRIICSLQSSLIRIIIKLGASQLRYDEDTQLGVFCLIYRRRPVVCAVSPNHGSLPGCPDGRTCS
jgi:hypothetical protein